MKYTAIISKGLLALLLAGTAVSCNNKKKSKDSENNTENMTTGDTLTTASGLKYVINKKGNGTKAEAGKKVTVHYTGKLMDGKVFDSSRDRDQPFSFELGSRQVIQGWEEGIALLREGDQATFILPSDLAYGPNGAGGVIPPNATLIFDVELLKVSDVEKPKSFDVEGKKINKTPSGLEYVIVKSNPSGTQATPGKTVSVHYTGYLVDGTIFDSSIPRGEPISFGLGQGQVIPGWDEGISLMKTGEKYRLIIPPSLGYGQNGAGGVIPPNATLLFDVELTDVK
jgi:peptidylprolyl isomerase